jgi:putative flippase GtrA
MDQSMWGKVVRFVIVGTTVTVLYFALCYMFRADLDLRPFFATLAAYPICMLCGYLGQKKFAFRSNAGHVRSLFRYTMLNLAVALTTAFSSQWATQEMGFSPFYMSVFATVVAGGVSFFVSLFWVFSEPAASERRRLA